MTRHFCDKCDQPIQGKLKHARVPTYKPDESRAFYAHLTHDGQTITDRASMWGADICPACAIEIMQAIIKENTP